MSGTDPVHFRRIFDGLHAHDRTGPVEHAGRGGKELPDAVAAGFQIEHDGQAGQVGTTHYSRQAREIFIELLIREQRDCVPPQLLLKVRREPVHKRIEPGLLACHDHEREEYRIAGDVGTTQIQEPGNVIQHWEHQYVRSMPCEQRADLIDLPCS